MSITIRKLPDEDGKLFCVLHQYHFIDGVLRDPMILMYIGNINDYGGLKIDTIYDSLDWQKDFEITERVSQITHENGLVYDDLTYKLKK